MTDQRGFKLNTVALHGGQTIDAETGSRAVPIYQTTSYQFKSVDHASRLVSLKELGHVYSRVSNPTNAVLEERIAELEGGVGAYAVSSGQSAVAATILSLANSGDEIVATSDLYGGVFHSLSNTYPKHFGVTVRFVDGTNVDALKEAINEKTKAIYTETIGNPSLQIADIEKLSDIAHAHGIPLIADSTFSTPFLERPIDFGADIVVHSATKFIGGHGTSIGGLIIDAGSFPWDNGNFPDFTESNPNLGHRSFIDVAGDAAFIVKARFEIGHDLGFALSPFNSWLFLQGLESLSSRMTLHVANAKKIASFLARHDQVEWVNYPSLEGDPQYDKAQKYLPEGAGSIFTFGIKGGLAAAKAFIDALQLISHVANVGDAKTLVVHPATVTHSRLSPEEQIKAGVTPEQIRLSIGLEDVDDIIDDLNQAFEVSAQASAKEVGN